MSTEHRGAWWNTAIVGVLCWIVLAVVLVAARGVRWDETYEHAQVITKQVAYPEGHPLFRYCRSAFSLQTYASAALMKWGAGPAAICGLRNVAMLLSTVLPLFLFGAWMGGGPLWGHAAALLALRGVYLEFDGSYPLTVWPDIFSNGAIGGGYALLVLYAFSRNRWRTGFFLTGLMPCIHIGQWPPVLAVAGVAGMALLWKKQWSLLAQGVAYGAAGLAICAMFAWGIKPFAVPPPAGGPYAVEGDAHAIWQGYTAHFDGHRQFPPGNGQLAMVGLLCLGGLSLVQRRSEAHPMLLYGAVIAAIVWGTMAVHACLGPHMPFLLIGWMPYRLVNHIGPLLLALGIGTLASAGAHGTPHAGRVAVTGAMVYAILLPVLPHMAGTALYQRYFAACDGVFFGLYGAAFAWILLHTGNVRGRTAGLALGLASFTALACYHHFGAACLLAGGVAVAIIARVPHCERLGNRALVAGLCVILGLELLAEQAAYRVHLPVSPFDSRLAAELAARGEVHAMLAAPPNEFLLQARTGHPVFIETATASLMSYMPALAPAINSMYHDAYGVSFDGPPRATPAVPWTNLWHTRTAAEWQAFGERYGIHYLVAGSSLVVQLPLVFGDAHLSLYRIPAP